MVLDVGIISTTHSLCCLMVMQSMGQRLIATENRQQHMMSFLAKAMQNPSFLAQLMQQSESNKRLAATVRKKRRLPKQDGGEEDSLSNDAQPEGQIVAFQPNSTVDPNGTRAMIMQFFNSTDASSPSLDSGPLEALFRDLGSAPSGQDVALNRQSGVTLTEMNISGLADSLPVNPLVRDVAKEPLDLPLPSLRIPRLEGTYICGQLFGAWNDCFVCCGKSEKSTKVCSQSYNVGLVIWVKGSVDCHF